MTSTLETMIASYEEAYRKDQILWRILCELENLPTMQDKPAQRVQVSRYIFGKDDEGNDRSTPIFAYSENDIREEATRNFNAGIGVFCNPRDAEKVAARRAKWDSWAEGKIAELSAIEAECKTVEDACGYTEALSAARASSERVRGIENAILEQVPTTLAEAALKARWIVQGMTASRAYFNDREDFDEVAFAAIGRAAS
jgi:hypothetical protein